MPTQDTTTSPSGLDVNKLLSELEVPFSPDQVRWRVTNTTNDKKRGQVVPYADPRAYTDRLNALFTPQGWTREYKVETMTNITRVKKGESIVSGKVLVTCTVTILGIGSHSGTGEEWADDDNGMTSADAQAFKRACSCFGLGRYFYEFRQSGSIWTKTASLSEHRCYRLGHCRRTGARGCGHRAGMGTEQPTHRTRTLVRTEAVGNHGQATNGRSGRPMAVETVKSKPQSPPARRRLAPATIWTRAFWDWRRPSAPRYSGHSAGVRARQSA